MVYLPCTRSTSNSVSMTILTKSLTSCTVLSVILVYFLVPGFGIYGYVVIVYLMEFINASLSIARLMSRISIKIELGKWVVKPLICIVGATSLTAVVTSLVGPSGLGTAGDAATAVGICALTYFVLLRLTGGVSGEDLRWFKRAIQ